MKYISQKMISKSRFKNYFKVLSENQRLKTVEILNRLIKENEQYTDKNNYGHLCNLLTALALVLMLEDEGMNRKDSQQIVSEAMYDYIQPQTISMQKLAKHKWFIPMLKLTMPIKFKHTLGYGWNVEFPKTSKNEYAMITHDCIYARIFSKYGMPEMTRNFCRVDDILYGNLPQTDFEYTQRIGTGGTMCDYIYRRR